MNKKNKILVGCLTLLLALSVGYALFSETITINGTATAKGNFTFITTCTPGDITGLNKGEDGYGEESCTVNDGVVSISTELKYPGARRYYTIEAKNTGSIDAMVKLDDEGYPYYGETFVPNVGLLKLYNRTDDSLYKTYNLMSDMEIPLNDYGYIDVAGMWIKKADGTIIYEDTNFNLEQRVYSDASGNNYLRLFPGESYITFIISEWYSGAVETPYYSVMSSSINFNIKQFNPEGLELNTNVDFCYDGC